MRNQGGIVSKGANAVLENKIGKLTIKINANNSIWPGKIKAKLRLNRLKNTVISKIIKMLTSNSENTIFVPILIFPITNKMIVCITLVIVINITEAISIEILELIGYTSKRFKKPNSRSKIIDNPAFKELENAVNMIIPEVKKIS
uniref:Uncharacterized protein n=1 Tax=Porphyridium purpureum TaxID=35688 RepID=W0S1V2_PORPP|nr:hypothetical protein Y721_p120 [Porphyridium purpureum]BAO23688.1 hypothetical protein [Porphyridium purpureum]